MSPKQRCYLSRERGLIENDKWWVCFRIHPMLIKIYSVSGCWSFSRWYRRSSRLPALYFSGSDVWGAKYSTRCTPPRNDEKSRLPARPIKSNRIIAKIRAREIFVVVSNHFYRSRPNRADRFHDRESAGFIAKFTM